MASPLALAAIRSSLVPRRRALYFMHIPRNVYRVIGVCSCDASRRESRSTLLNYTTLGRRTGMRCTFSTRACEKERRSLHAFSSGYFPTEQRELVVNSNVPQNVLPIGTRPDCLGINSLQIAISTEWQVLAWTVGMAALIHFSDLGQAESS